MALGIGGSKSKSKSTTDQTYNKTSTPTNPEWVNGGVQGVGGIFNGLAGQDPSSFVAGPSELQQQGFGAISGLGAQGLGYLTQAGQMAGQGTGATFSGYDPAMASAASVGPAAQATAQSTAQNMGGYFNPYLQNVAGNTLADMGRGLTLAENANGQGAALAGQYGGSRQGVMDANTQRDFFDRAGSTLGNLYAGGFNTAAQLGQGDADRFTNTSQFNAGQTNTLAALQAQMEQQTALANQVSANQGGQFNASGAANNSQFNSGQEQQRAQLLASLGQYGLGSLMDAGATQQGLDQQKAQAPLTMADFLAGGWSQLPLGLFQGGTESGTNNTKSKGSNTGLSAAFSYGK